MSSKRLKNFIASGVGVVSSTGLESAIVNMPDDVTPETVVSPSIPSWNVMLGLLLLMFVAALLRAQHMREPLWLDELHTAWVVQDNLSDVADRAAAGNQGSIFYYVQWYLGCLMPPSEWRYRCLSLAAGLCLIPVMFLVAREVCQSAWAGWVAAAMTGIDRFSVYFSCEARPYACVQLLTVIHLYLGYRRLQRPTPGNLAESRWYRAAWIASGVLLFYLHYTAALILVAEVLAWLVLLFARPQMIKITWRQLAIDLLAVALLCAPALPHLVWINGRRTAWFEFVSVPGFRSLLTLLPLLTYLAIPLGVVLSQRLLRRVSERQSDRRTWLALLTCCLFFPQVFTWLTTFSGLAALYIPRYLMGSLTVSILLSASLVGMVRTARLRTVTVLVLALVVLLTESAISFSWLIPAERPWPGFLHRAGIQAKREEWSSLVEHVNAHDAEGRFPVFLAPGLIEDRQLGQRQSAALHARISRQEFCLFPVRGCYRLRDSTIPTVALASHSTALPEQYLNRLRIARGGWFIVRGRRRAKDWRQLIEETFDDEDFSYRADLEYFGSLGLIRLQPLPVRSLPDIYDR